MLYGTERPFRELLVSPLNTLYYQYWRPWVNELYSSDARKLTAHFRLTRAELATFEFSDKIYIKDTYWRILSISYDATSEGLAKVELIKILGDIRDCAWLPYSVDKFGQLTFENAAGTTSTTVPTSCCERYGYRFHQFERMLPRHAAMRNLDNHRYIGEAIQLLQAKGERVRVPLWFKVLDWFLATLYVSALAFALYSLGKWLILKIYS